MDRAGQPSSRSRYPRGHGVSAVRIDVDIMKDSVKILPDQEDPGKFLVEFTYHAYVDGRIAFHIYKKVGENMSSTTEDLPPQIIEEFGQGLLQKFRQNSGTGISLTSLQVGMIDEYHLVLKAYGSANRAQVTVAVFEKAEGECRVSSTRQMLLVNGVQYEWHDIGDCYDSAEVCPLESESATVLPGPHQTVPPPLCMALYDQQHHHIALDPAAVEWYYGHNHYRHGVSSIKKHVINIRKETMNIVPDQEDPEKFHVEFTCDVLVAGSITISFGAKLDERDDFKVMNGPSIYNLQVGPGQEFKFKDKSGPGVRISLYNPCTVILIWALVPPCLSEDGDMSYETTFFQETEVVFERKNVEFPVRITSQTVVNRMVYVGHDIDEVGSDYDWNDHAKKCLHCSLESQDATALPEPHQIVPHLTEDSPHIYEMSENLASLHVNLHPRNILRKIGTLSIFDKRIGMGSNGTVVFEGRYDDGREVAVKRIVKEHFDVAVKEIEHLITSDWHPNIVRYHGMETGQNFVYVALERCVCSLHDLILLHTNSSDELQPTAEVFKDMELWKHNGYPSPDLFRLMRLDLISFFFSSTK